MAVWRTLECSCKDLQLLLTLSGGQCFRWHKNEDGEWTGVFAQRIWTLKQTDDNILYQVQYAVTSNAKESKTAKRQKAVESHKKNESRTRNGNSVDDEKILRNYFRLDTPLDELYSKWSEKDPNFKEIAAKFYGVRMLRQHPVENIFSFICSSNNNISRISSMVEKMCLLYGSEVGKKNNQVYYAFPDVDQLADPSVEQDLRKAGFGYRAKFIQKSAAMILSQGGQSWLESLQDKPYEEAKSALMELPGIGAKVADCICLMSLDHLEAIPVDTHVWQISCRYLPHLQKYKSVTERVYNEIGDYFRALYGPYAGWAHTVLFCADLKMFQEKTQVSKRKASKAQGKEEIGAELKRKKGKKMLQEKVTD
ncbi:N-glycosylase/DNA lyase [Frankliniella fusca]|uniref:N-glycosylase/DNA lyase n=1 Tax=Frankliniella fusca TaxID=407009 RepID=A0AAE1H055_9NEOP|nr:N-glycosylase/DNA lyase [Frankliniella fusca]